MIPASNRPGQPPVWIREMQRAIRDPETLFRELELPESGLPGAGRAAGDFPLRVPRGYVARMTPGDIDDPLLRQVLPVDVETEPVEGFVEDPVGDLDQSLQPGLLQKYAGRVLLVATGACGIHCRYCFRRHFPYADNNPRAGQWEPALARIRDDDTIREVILSGGDPLTLTDDRLSELAARLADIPHVRTLRIHSRQPVVLPERIDDRFTAWLGRLPLRRVMVVHANHPNEIDGSVAAAIRRLRSIGVTVLNQSVLLAGINDDTDRLAELSERLFDAGALPYYLHLLDPVAGAAHFLIPDDRAVAIHRQLMARLPGYLVPKLVREIEGHTSKVPVDLGLENDASIRDAGGKRT